MTFARTDLNCSTRCLEAESASLPREVREQVCEEVGIKIGVKKEEFLG